MLSTSDPQGSANPTHRERHRAPVGAGGGEGVEELGPVRCWRERELVRPPREAVCRLLGQLRRAAACPAVPLLGTSTKAPKAASWKGIHTPGLWQHQSQQLTRRSGPCPAVDEGQATRAPSAQRRGGSVTYINADRLEEVGGGGRGWLGGDECLMQTRVPVWNEEKVPETAVVLAAYLPPLGCALRMVKLGNFMLRELNHNLKKNLSRLPPKLCPLSLGLLPRGRCRPTSLSGCLVEPGEDAVFSGL